MRLLPVPRLDLNRSILLVAACLVLALGCQPGMRIDAVVQTKSCTDDANTMVMKLHSTSTFLGYLFDGGTTNVLGIPYAYSNGNALEAFYLVQLNHVNLNEKVTVKFHAFVILANTLTVSLADVSFHKAAWYTYPTVPDCAVAHTPTFTITQPVPHRSAALALSDGVTVEVTNPNPLPMSLVSLEMVESPALLDPASLDWDNPVFNALPWQSAAPGGALLDAAGPPLVVNLPGTMTGQAILCRFVSVYNGMEVDCIMQASPSAALAVKSSSWGAVKALYRK